jgi:hypothetical protein
MAKSSRAAPIQGKRPRIFKIPLDVPFEHATNRSNPDPNAPMMHRNQPDNSGYPVWAAAIPSPKGKSRRAKGLGDTCYA